MTRSPFARVNAATICADRRQARTGLAAVATLAVLALGLLMLAHMGLQLALDLPDILAQSAARAAW